jgi:enediyne biosynthesis protein E4
MIDFDITIVVVFILAYIIAYLLDKVEVWSVILLFFVIYFLFTQISFDASEVGFDFTIDYYIKIGVTQAYNYITDLFGVDKVLIYPKIETDFKHKYSGIGKPQSKRTVHQSVASTPIDIFGDGIEYIYVGGGKGQDDAILKPIFNNDELRLKKMVSSITSQVSDKKSATYSAVAFDITGNGVQDLIVSRQNGVVIYENRSSDKKMKFVKNVILEGYVFENSAPIALCVGDVNLNGKPDILISQFTYPSKLKAFQFNNDKHWAPNILLENVSSKNKILYVDSTDKYNLSGVQNTFTSSFVVLDRNYSSDNDNEDKDKRVKPAQVINSNDTGKFEINSPSVMETTIDGKNKEKTFRYSRLVTEDQTFPNGFWMGLAIGDVNNDGRLDMFSTNLGKDIPLPSQGTHKGTRGSEKTGLKPDQYLTHDHLLLMNRSDDEVKNGVFKFQNAAKAARLAIDGIGWGCVFEDFTLNGFLDLFYAQNYIDMASLNKYDSAVYMIENEDELSDKTAIPKFQKVQTMENPNFCHTPMFCDFGKTGLKDLVWVNINGPLVAYQNNNLLDNNFVSIRLPKNIKYLNASVVIRFKNENHIMQRQNIVGGIGLSGDQSSTMVFGLGKRTLEDVKSVKIYSMYKPYVVDITDKVKLNERIVIK